MIELKYKDTDKYYWCAWGDYEKYSLARKLLLRKDICVFGKLESGQRVTTGQPNFATFSTEAELKAKVDSLKGAGYYEKKEGHDL